MGKYGLLSLDPLLAPVHLLAHWICKLNSGLFLLKKIAKFRGDLIEYESQIRYFLTQDNDV